MNRLKSLVSDIGIIGLMEMIIVSATMTLIGGIITVSGLGLISD